MPETPRWDGPPVETWSMGWTPDQVTEALDGLAAPWAVAGGWALDLWLGKQTREHEDIEITVPALFFPEVQARLEARGQLFSNVNGEVVALQPGEARGPEGFQTWVTDPAAQAWILDIFREPGDAETWIYRRTGELSAPRTWASGRTAAGIPYVAPQVVLLFKAKPMRDKDLADFARIAPMLPPDDRAWLAASLSLIQPGHPWIERLAG
jgi:Aminoglycoside-2''-adenylyltransferase